MNNNRPHVLVVDDDLITLKTVKMHLVNADYEVTIAEKIVDAKTLLKKKGFDLVITDNLMPESSGLELAKYIREKYDKIEIVVMTAYPSDDIIDMYCNLGINYFIFKPFHENQLLYTLHGVFHHLRTVQTLCLEEKTNKAQYNIIGVSQAIRQIRTEVETFAQSSVPIVINGETGTGKEVIANCIHMISSRKNYHLIPVNCATLNVLTESSLFGHCKGAFTGAGSSAGGYVGNADKGTLFLDEVGELPLETQAKLLRFLDSGEYYPVGSNTPVKADVRIICASNSDLKDRVKEKLFRDDLYYRLSGTTIELPPLRSRTEDIPHLVRHFIEFFSSLYNKTFCISEHAIEAFMNYAWPGNVRELKQTVHALTQRCSGKGIAYYNVIDAIGHTDNASFGCYKDMKEEAIIDFDRDYFARVILLSRGSLKRALEISNMHKKNFYEKLKKYDLSLKSAKGS